METATTKTTKPTGREVDYITFCGWKVFIRPRDKNILRFNKEFKIHATTLHNALEYGVASVDVERKIMKFLLNASQYRKAG